MREQVDRLTKLTTDLLDLSRLDAGRDRDRAKRCRPARPGRRRSRPSSRRRPMRREIGARRSRRIGSGGAEADPIRVGPDPPYPARQRAHPHAARDADQRSRRSQPRGERPNGFASLTVTDDGPGIDAAIRDASSSASTPATPLSGSGLGLAIAQRAGGTHARAPRRDLAPGQTELRARAPRRATAGPRRWRRAPVAPAYPGLAAALRSPPAVDRRAGAATGRRRDRARQSRRERLDHDRRTVEVAAGGGRGRSRRHLRRPRRSTTSASPGVVTVISIFGRARRGSSAAAAAAGQGSGFVINDEGRSLTNAHVSPTPGGRPAGSRGE